MMANKKLALVILLILISLFVVMITAITSGGDSKKIATLESNVKVLNEKMEEIKLRTDEWDRIINGTTEVDLGTAPTDKEVTAPTEPKTPTDTSAPEKTPATPTEPKEEVVAKEYTVNASNLNLRSDPTSKGSVVRQVPSGEKLTSKGVESKGEGYTWIQVTDSKGNIGWAVSDFLK
jgi:uncharacterized protein YgiM (DUF1202 family)